MTPQPSFQGATNTTAVMNRYADAYRVANVITGLGRTIKIIALIVGVFIFLVGTRASSGMFGEASAVFGLLSGAVVAGIGFVLGTLLSAQGQVLKATLDAAVNSSPFLQNEQRAELMRLS
jgi:hypothetical protein